MRRLQALFVSAAAAAAAPAAAQPLPGLAPTLPAAPGAAEAKTPPRVEALRNLPAGAPRSQGPWSLVVVTQNTADPAEPGVRRVVFREEATRLDYFTRYDGGSLTGSVRIRCAQGDFQLESFRLYSRNNLEGALLTTVDRRSEWRVPGQDTVVGRAMALACNGRPSPPPARTEVSAAVAPRPPASPAAPAPDPSPAPALRGPVDGARESYAGGVQVGAAGSADGAREVLDKLRRAEPKMLEPYRLAVAPATVNGKAVFRALVSGFPDRAAATRFCGSLTARGHACFVRD